MGINKEIKTTQELIDALLKVKDRDIRPFIACAADSDLIKIGEVVEEKDLKTGELKIILTEAI